MLSLLVSMAAGFWVGVSGLLFAVSYWIDEIWDLPVTNMETASSAHSRLQRLIQRIIEEAIHLPAFLDFSGTYRDSTGKLPEFNPSTYEDLLATAILNKVIGDRYQTDPKRSTGASSSGVHSGSSSPGCENVPPSSRGARRRGRPRTSIRDGIGLDRSSPEPASHDDYANSDSSGRASENLKSAFLKNDLSSDEEEASAPFYQDPVETALSTINFQNKTRVIFPEYGGDVVELDCAADVGPFITDNDSVEVNNNTDIFTNNNSWEENWLFQKKKVKNSQSVSVPMLVPNPNTECRALIGDQDIEDTTDLSEAEDSDCEDKPCDAYDIKKVLIDSKTVIGGKNPALALLDEDVIESEIPIDSGTKILNQSESNTNNLIEMNNNDLRCEKSQNIILEPVKICDEKKLSVSEQLTADVNNDPFEAVFVAANNLGEFSNSTQNQDEQKQNMLIEIDNETGMIVETKNQMVSTNHEAKETQGELISDLIQEDLRAAYLNEDYIENAYISNIPQSTSDVIEKDNQITKDENTVTSNGVIESIPHTDGETSNLSGNVIQKATIEESVAKQLGFDVNDSPSTDDKLERTLEKERVDDFISEPIDEVAKENMNNIHTDLTDMSRKDQIEEVTENIRDESVQSVENLPTPKQPEVQYVENIADTISTVYYKSEILELQPGEKESIIVKESTSTNIVVDEIRLSNNTRDDVELSEINDEPIINTKINNIHDLVESLEQDQLDTSMPSITVTTDTFIVKEIHQVDDSQDADGHQEEGEYLETIAVPVQRHMDSLKRQHNIRLKEDGSDPPPLPTSRLPDKNKVPVEEMFIPGSIAEREHKKWQNAIYMENNPYSPEAIERRLAKLNKPQLFNVASKTPNPSLDEEEDVPSPKTKPLQEAFKEDLTEFQRYGRDYYINESKKGTGTRKQLKDLAAEYSSEEYQVEEISSPVQESSTTLPAVEHVNDSTAGSAIEIKQQISHNDGVYSAVPAKSVPDLYSDEPMVAANVEEQFEIVYEDSFSHKEDLTSTSPTATDVDSKLGSLTNGSATHSDLLDISDCVSSPDDSMLVYNIQSGKVVTSSNNINNMENESFEEEGEDRRITSTMINNINKSWKSTGDVYLAAIELKDDTNKDKGHIVIEEDLNLPSVKDLRRKFVSQSKEEIPLEKPKRKISKDFPTNTITKTFSNSHSNMKQPIHMHSLTARSIPKEFRDELKLSMPVQTNVHPGGSKEIPEGVGQPIKEGMKDRADSPQPEPGSLKNKLAFFEKLNNIK